MPRSAAFVFLFCEKFRLDGFIAADGFSSAAKDLVPAAKLLTKNRAVKIFVAQYTCFSSTLSSLKKQRSCQ